MQASPSSSSQPKDGAPAGLPALLHLLLGVVRAVVFPFDRVLAGMVGAGLCVEALCRFLGLSRATLFEHVVRLGLPTPVDKPFREPGARGWSVADTRLVIALRSAGVHPEVIGESLPGKRSANAVRAKCRRLGLTPPPRKDLFRPDPARLRELASGTHTGFEAAAPSTRCGQVAGPVHVGGSLPVEAPAPAWSTKDVPVKCASERPARRLRASRGLDRPDGQRELSLLGVVGGAQQTPLSRAVTNTLVVHPLVPVPPCAQPAAPSVEADQPKPTPATVGEVDFTDLSWIGRLKRPLSCEPAVWAVGMLIMAGVDRHTVAGMVGKTEASLRTLRTRMRVPVDEDRKKATDVFDLEVAQATRERGKWIIRRELAKDGPPKFFWVQRGDRTTFLSPVGRKRDHLIEGRYPIMTIITRAMLDAEARMASSLGHRRLPPTGQFPRRAVA